MTKGRKEPCIKILSFHFYWALWVCDVQLIFDNSEKLHASKPCLQATTVFSISECIFKKLNSFYHEIYPSLGYPKESVNS